MGRTIMRDGIDWSVTTFEGNRRRQLNEFRALSFREKLKHMEQMGEVIQYFASQRTPAPQPKRGKREGTTAGAAIDAHDA